MANSKRGSVYIYILKNIWELSTIIDGENPDDGFGRSVSIYNDKIVVGARHYYSCNLNLTTASKSGSAFIIKYNQIKKIWEKESILIANNIASNSAMGSSVSIYNNKIFIGATNNDSTYYFDYNNNNLGKYIKIGNCFIKNETGFFFFFFFKKYFIYKS